MFPSLFIDSLVWSLFSSATLGLAIYGASRYIRRRTGLPVPNKLIPNSFVGWWWLIPFIIFTLFECLRYSPNAFSLPKEVLISYNFFEISTTAAKLAFYAISAALPWITTRISQPRRPT